MLQVLSYKPEFNYLLVSIEEVGMGQVSGHRASGRKVVSLGPSKS